MPRLLGLDVGTVRLGVALSDELGWTAQPLEVIKRRGDDTDLNALGELIARHEVAEIVVGLPKNMNDTLGPMAEQVRGFEKKLSERFNLPVHEWDERLTTAQAERMLIDADMRRDKRKRVIDKIAAALILQGFLDLRRNQKK